MELENKIADVLDDQGNVINTIVLRADDDPANWNAVWNDERNNEELAILVRAKRDELLATEVDAIAMNSLRYGALTEEEKQSLADKRQALLYIPQQEGFPNNVVWPE